MVLLVLAAALGLVAQGAQAAGMGPTIAAASSARTAMSDRCGECSDKSDHGGTFASICTVACAVTPALTTAVAAPLDVQPAIFPPAVELSIAGLEATPDPFPPRPARLS